MQARKRGAPGKLHSQQVTCSILPLAEILVFLQHKIDTMKESRHTMQYDQTFHLSVIFPCTPSEDKRVQNTYKLIHGPKN